MFCFSFYTPTVYYQFVCQVKIRYRFTQYNTIIQSRTMFVFFQLKISETIRLFSCGFKLFLEAETPSTHLPPPQKNPPLYNIFISYFCKQKQLRGDRDKASVEKSSHHKFCFLCLILPQSKFAKKIFDNIFKALRTILYRRLTSHYLLGRISHLPKFLIYLIF